MYNILLIGLAARAIGLVLLGGDTILLRNGIDSLVQSAEQLVLI